MIEHDYEKLARQKETQAVGISHFSAAKMKYPERSNFIWGEGVCFAQSQILIYHGREVTAAES